MVLSGSHANRKMIRTVWCSAKRKLSVLLVSLCKMVRPTGALTKEIVWSVGLAVGYSLMFWYAKKYKEEKTWLSEGKLNQ